jgi:hypothetical protein
MKYIAILPAIILAGLLDFSVIPPEQSVLDLSTASAREEYVFKFWKDRGLTDVQASAVVGNFMGETRMGDLLDPTTVGGWKNQALGIEQALGKRKTNLLNFAKEKGVDLFKSPLADSLRVENEFAFQEFMTSEAPAWQKLIKATTIDSAETAMGAMERYSGYALGPRAAEAGTHYLWAHAVYDAVKSGTLGKKTLTLAKAVRHTTSAHSQSKKIVGELPERSSNSIRAFMPVHVSPSFSPVAVVHIFEELPHLLPH